MKPDQYVENIQKALSTYDEEAVDVVCQSLVSVLFKSDEVFPEAQAKKIINALRRKRFFRQMIRVADAFIQSGQRSPLIRRQYAQALLDLGQLTAAESILRDLVSDPLVPFNELAEGYGLLGRTFKQYYINAGSPDSSRSRDFLEKAVDFYNKIYQANPASFLWHGINTVALLSRAKRDEIPMNAYPNPFELASAIRSQVDKMHKAGSASMWDYGTAAEACLALKDYDQALDWVARYVQRKQADAFEFGSTLRQFQEVWQLNDSKEPGMKIIQVLKAALLKQAGSEVEIPITVNDLQNIRDVQEEIENHEVEIEEGGQMRFEKVFGNDLYVSFDWWLTGIERSRLVGRVEHKATRREIGSGFLISGKALSDNLDDEWYYLTNEHVVSDSADNMAVGYEQAILNFEVNKEDSIGVKEIVTKSSRQELDFCLLKIEQPATALQDYGISKHLPLLDPPSRAYIIGHPMGRKLSLSINDNLILDHQAPKIHYRTPTEPGSSGSPIFNGDWDLIGLHHAGSDKIPRLDEKNETYSANEGIWIQSIREDINA